MIQLQTIRSKKSVKTRQERASVTASVTVEAAMAFPLFLFAVLCLIYLLEVQAIGYSIRHGASHAGKVAAEDVVLLPFANPIKMQADIVNFIGAERINRSIISGGTGGISCFGSYVEGDNDEIVLVVRYEVKLPVPTFGSPTVKREEELRVKAWTGYVKSTLESEDDQIVYVTTTGQVYHVSYHCTHLQLSIEFVTAEEAKALRNEGGGIYHPCEKCVFGGMMAGVYITNSGGRYHNSLSCSGLKRTIRAVPLSQVKGLGGCQRCS